MENQPKSGKSKDAIYITIIVLLLGAAALGFYSMSSYKTQLAGCAADRDAMQKDLNEMAKMLEANGSNGEDIISSLSDLMTDFQALETSNVGMRDSIDRQIRAIDSLQQLAQKHKGDAYMIYKLKKEAETLRSIMQGYVHTIDSLNTMNKELRADLKVTKDNLTTAEKERDDVKEKNKDLEGKVAKGSILTCANMSAGAIHLRSSGKQVETTRAGRADMVKACCTIMENAIAKSGTKQIYMVVTMPDATVLTKDPNARFKWEGGESQYSLVREIDYQNASMDLCLYAEVNGDLPKGVYNVDLYCEKAKIGHTTFTLK